MCTLWKEKHNVSLKIQTPHRGVSRTLPFLQKKADEVSFAANYSVSKNASISIHSCAADLPKPIIGNLDYYGHWHIMVWLL